jgi:hypothetical protein
VPAHVIGYRYTYVNDHAALVDPRTTTSLRSSINVLVCVNLE